MKKTGVEFQTSDEKLKKIFDGALAAAKKNYIKVDNGHIIQEGGGYVGLWNEGASYQAEMLAPFDLETAFYQVEVVRRMQRRDGRVPGMIKIFTSTDAECQYEDCPVEAAGLVAYYGWLQGFSYAEHALNMYYYLGLDNAYLEKVYDCLESYDKYLWAHRDSDGDGCLETWCEWDTGDDNSVMVEGMLHGWGEDDILPSDGVAPFESMDAMSWSYNMRDTLAKISRILDNGKEQYWKDAAQAVQDKLHDYLWIEDKAACYNRDKNNEFVDILVNNNIRCLYYGSFSQDMADKFITKHMLNPEEFWTPMPFPSIAFNDPHYVSKDGNSWSGQTQGHTVVRGMYGFDKYGYYAEETELGKRIFNAVTENCYFPQQWDPQTCRPNSFGENNNYTPILLAALTMIARLHGVTIQGNEIWWAAVEDGSESTYVQHFGDKEYKLEVRKDNRVYCFLDGEEIFNFDTGFRVITDYEGNIKRLVRIEEDSKAIIINKRKYRLHKNEVLKVVMQRFKG